MSENEVLLQMIERLRRELLNVDNLRAPCDLYVSQALISRAVTEADALLANFPRPSQNQTVSCGVEGAHEGATVDKKAELPREHQCVSANDCPLCDEYIPAGAREPEKLNNAQTMDAESTELAEFAMNEQVALAESSLNPPSEFKKHLRPYGKRRFWRKVRAKLKKLLKHTPQQQA